MKDIIKTLYTKKTSPDGDIPVKLIKMNEDIFSRLLFQNFNQYLINGEFPHCLKQAEVIPVFKKEEKLDKSNYRFVSILPVISKIMKGWCMTKCINILIKSSLNFNAVFVKDLAPRTFSYIHDRKLEIFRSS